jgi:hypothetical protein
MELADRLQLKPGTVITIVALPADGPDLAGLPLAGDGGADDGAVLAFARCRADLTAAARPAIDAARADRLCWICYPKAGQLGTDLNRDSLAAALAEHGVQPVRQVSVDSVWSALRIRPA